MKLMQLGRLALLSLVLSAGTIALTPIARADDDKKVMSSEQTFGVGSKAPAIKVEKYLKGNPISEFKSGHVYVVEFWATWCGPCIRAFPHLSELQEANKDKVTFIGINIWERKYDDKTIDTINKFMEKHGTNMRYTVAYDGNAKAMSNGYMVAANRNFIPHAFVVNQEGTIAWIGHPGELDDVLPKVLNKTWDMTAAKAKFQEEAEAGRKEQEQQAAAQKEMKQVEPQIKELQRLLSEGNKEEALPLMLEVAEKAPNVGIGAASQALTYMLIEKKDYAKGYEFANKMVDGPYANNAQALNMIAWTIVDPEAGIQQRNLDIALKAAKRASELENNQEPAILDTLARVYFEKGDKAKAIETQTKAVELASGEMKADLQKSLEEYKK